METHRPLVVVVDDEPAILNALRRELRREPWEVQYYSSPAEALAAIRKNIPQVVISDNLMPEMTGEDLLKKVQFEFPDTKRIMLTGSSGKRPGNLSNEMLGLARVIKKPWDHEQLIQTVREALEGRS